MERFNPYRQGCLPSRSTRASAGRGRNILTPPARTARVARLWTCLDNANGRGGAVRVKSFGHGNFAGGRLCSWLTATAGLVAAAGHAQAFEPTRYLSYTYGPLSLRPRVSVQEAFNDNITYRGDGPAKQADLISNLGAGISMTLGHRPDMDPYNILGEGGGRNYVGLDYMLGESLYASHGELDGVHHSLSSNLRLQGNRLSLTGKDSVEVSDSVLGGGINQGSKTSLTAYQDNYRLNYELSTKTSVYAAGAYSATDYAQGTPLLDLNTLNGTLGFGWSAFPKTSFFGETYYGQSAINPNRSVDAKGPHLSNMGGFLGIRGNFTPRIAGVVKVGYETREFSNNSPAEDAPVVDLQLTYRLGERTRTMVTYSRNVSVSVQTPGEAVTYDTFAWKITRSIGAASRWVANVGADYQIGSFGNGRIYANRRDDWYHANCSLSYLIRLWMIASLSYEFENFASTAAAQGIIDYRANRVTIKLSVGY